MKQVEFNTEEATLWSKEASMQGTKLDELCFYLYLDKNYHCERLDDFIYLTMKKAFFAGQRSIKRRMRKESKK